MHTTRETSTGTVTFLFTDIEGSTQLWEQHSPSMHAALAHHDALLRQAIESHHGQVFKTVGDAFYAVFFVPQAAVEAAVAAQRALQKELPQIRVRMAAHTGEAETREGDYFGPALNQVARLLSAGHGGQVLLSRATTEQLRAALPEDTGLRSLGEHRLRDLPYREAIYQLMPAGLKSEFPPLNTLDVAFRRGVVRATAVALVVLTVMLGLALAAMTQAHRANQQRRLADQQRQVAEERRQEARRNLYAAQMRLPDEANPVLTQEMLEAQRPAPGEEDLRGFEWRYLWRRSHQDDSLFTFHGHAEWVRSVAFSPDGRLLASGSTDGHIKLWNLRTRRELAGSMEHGAEIWGIALSPDGKLLASAGRDKTVRLWDIAARRAVATLRSHQDSVMAVAFSPDGRLLASSSEDKTIKLWDVPSRRLIATLRGHRDGITALAFSPNGRLLASGGDDWTARLWDVNTKAEVATLSGHRGMVRGIAFSPDGRMLASGGTDFFVRLWTVEGTARGLLPGRRHGRNPGVRVRPAGALPVALGASWCVAFSPDGKTLASASWNGTAGLWDVATRRPIATLRGHRDGLFAVAFSPDGKTLATSSGDKTVKLWRITAGRDTDRLQTHRRLKSVAFAPDGHTVAAGSIDGTVTIWNASTKRELARFKAHRDWIYTLLFSRDQKLLATGSLDGSIKLWSLAGDAAARRSVEKVRARELACFSHPGSAGGVAFSPDGRLLARVEGEKVKLWDLTRHRDVTSFVKDVPGGGGVAFSPDGKLLAADTTDGIKLWQIATGREVASLLAYPPFAFSPDGKTLAGMRDYKTVNLWDVATRQRLAMLEGYGSLVDALAFSPDSKTLAACGKENTVKLWAVAARQHVATLKGHTARIWSIAFSPDGNTLASASDDTTVRLWRALPFSQTDTVRIAAIAGSDRAVSLQWRPIPSALGYTLYRGPAGASSARLARLTPQPVTAASYTDHSPGMVNGRTEIYGVAALFPGAGGEVIEGPLLRAQAVPVAPPPRFRGCSINEGEAGRVGSLLFDPVTSSLTLRGSGQDIWGEADGCYFLNQPVAGDFQVTVKMLTRPTQTDEWAQAGLMVREGLEPGARHASLVVHAARGLAFKWRPAAQDLSGRKDVLANAALRLPILLRLTRQGSTIRPEYSEDGGRSFRLAAASYPFAPPLAETVNVGVAITARDPNRITEARCSDLAIRKR